MKCPHCELQLVYRGELSAPGRGQAYICDNGHYFVRLGETLHDTVEWANNHPGEEPPWIMSIDDVR